MARRFEKMIPIPTRSERVIWWVRHFCLVPDGPTRGQQVLLSPEQRAQVRAIYDDGKPEPVAAPLAAYLALLHVAGAGRPAAARGRRHLEGLAVGLGAPEDWLRRDGRRIVPPKLGTSHPPPAA